MELELRGKTALVTGASKGIGHAVALGLAREGARVALCARDATALERVAKDIAGATHTDVVAVPGDLSRETEVTRVAQHAHERLGRLDILVNNAGAIRGGDFLQIPDAQWVHD